jgi:hypothetical protein
MLAFSWLLPGIQAILRAAADTVPSPTHERKASIERKATIENKTE